MPPSDDRVPSSVPRSAAQDLQAVPGNNFPRRIGKIPLPLRQYGDQRFRKAFPSSLRNSYPLVSIGKFESAVDRRPCALSGPPRQDGVTRSHLRLLLPDRRFLPLPWNGSEFHAESARRVRFFF